jgi:phosphohistidine swiveling domain-containing protein
LTVALDPTNAMSESTRYWTTANIGEATPDVLSPMCWSFWGPLAEAAARRAYHRFGILSKSELVVPTDVNQLMTGHFFGRPALNVDLLRPYFGSLPGVSADDFERDLCGKVRPNLPNESRRSRLPAIVVRGVLAMKSTPTRQEDLGQRQRDWWEREVRDRVSAGNPLERLNDAAERFRNAFEIHCCGRFVLMSAHATIAKLAAESGKPERFLGLLGGLGGVTELKLADDLWGVSRGDLSIEAFVARHGFHGPNEGNLTARSWREDVAPIERLVGSLERRPESERPVVRESVLGAERRTQIEEFVAALPGRRRSRAHNSCEALVASTQANEVSKAAFLMAIDGGRAAARDLGRQLVADRLLDDVDDVFFFTIDELHALPTGARNVARERRGRRDFYRTVSLPVTFTGTPLPLRPADSIGVDTSFDHGRGEELIIRGAAGAQGVVEGSARVMVDPETAEPLEPGEILVCRFTDPSWTPLLLLAAGAVIDIGGPASHGAIVARELGLPCVIGVGDGTQRIRTGDRLVVDGSAGTVRIVVRASGDLR